MADVSVKMGVSGIAQFKSAMIDAQQSVKTLDAQLKLNEKQLKAGADAEASLNAKTDLLNQKLKAQKEVAKNAENALKQMKANGVEESSKAFQTMQQRLAEAQSAMLDTEAELNNVGTSASSAATKADSLSSSLSGISKKMSLDQVVSGIGTITSAMETASSKAAELGEAIWNNVMNSAQWADDTATMAAMWNIPVETLQQMQFVSTTMDTSVDSILAAQTKLRKGVGSESTAVMETLEKLGVATRVFGKDSSNGEGSLVFNEDDTELFWEVGKAIMSMTDAEEEQEAAAQTMFGKSWRELTDLFDKFDSLEDYQKALSEANYVDEDQVDDLATLNDTVAELEENFNILKRDISATIAPALTKAAEAMSGLLSNLLEFLNTDKGQAMLDQLATSVSELFSGIGEINTEDLAQGIIDTLNGIVDGLDWIVRNKDGIVTALETIFGLWATLKVSEGVLTIGKIISGISGLSSSAAAAAGAAAGGSWATAFGAAVIKAVPWIAGLAVLFDTSNAGSNDVTMGEFLANASTGSEYESEVIGEISGRYGYGINDLYQNEELAGQLWEALNKGFTTYDELFRRLESEYGWEAGPVKGEKTEEVYIPEEMTENMQEAAESFWDYIKTVEKKQSENLDVSQFEALNEAFKSSPELLEKLWQVINDKTEGTDVGDREENLPEGWWAEVEPEVPEGAAEKVSEEIGTVDVYGVLHIVDANGNEVTISDWTGLGGMNAVIGGSHANGLWSVPFDGYTAILHKGERVMSAREVENSRNYSSNLYVESMYMNNGTDAAGLASAMAAAQRRTMYGYGS